MKPQVPDQSNSLDRREFLAAASAAAMTFNIVPNHVLSEANGLFDCGRRDGRGCGLG